MSVTLTENDTADLKEGLLLYSPLRLTNKKSPAAKAREKPSKDGEIPPADGDLMVETGEPRTPSHRNILSLLKQRRALAVKFNDAS